MSQDQEVESMTIWEAFLTPRLFYHRLRPSKGQCVLLGYQTNLVSRQFGLVQMKSKCLYDKRNHMCLYTLHLTEEEFSTTAVARKRKIKEAAVQKDSGVSKSNKTSGSDSTTIGKNPTTSKPAVHLKRKASHTVVSEDEDKYPPRTRQGHKKRQKAVTPSDKEKGFGSSKITSPSDKDDAGTTTSNLKAFDLAIDFDNLQNFSQYQSHVLSPVLEDTQPLATIIPTTAVEESHSTDDSPPTHTNDNMGEDRQGSGSVNAAEQPTGSEDNVSEQNAMEETSKLAKTDLHETLTFGTLQSNILRKQNVDEQLTAKMTSHSSSWKAATDATKKGDALKLKRLKNQEVYDECEKNIKSWKQEIKMLEEKIKEAESRQIRNIDDPQDLQDDNELHYDQEDDDLQYDQDDDSHDDDFQDDD
ncbi:uncharacterized protein LOC131614089 [Vicia villosa]|uniref:uncharacterized protein LOC131614089 n=1 Tax=Vicia villosa TaxID=3911 RepID=UPI00273B7262|nr:uncharacterized protein LOC131614089 [Vicia villosa]